MAIGHVSRPRTEEHSLGGVGVPLLKCSLEGVRMLKIVIARYGGSCVLCRRRYLAGSRIVKRTVGWCHVACTQGCAP